MGNLESQFFSFYAINYLEAMNDLILKHRQFCFVCDIKG